MENKNKKYVAYYRCSTIEQGKSGLGLDGQKTTVTNYVNGHGLLVGEFIEVETGTRKRFRPEIHKAIQLAKREKATLVIAKLDRLSRNVSFISSLMDSGVEFVACDMPTANNFTIHIFAALAEQEAKLISERTKTSLAELKAKGIKLGNPKNLTSDARARGVEVRIFNAKNHVNNIKASAMVILLKDKGMALSHIANELNRLKYETRRGGVFRAETVKRLIKSALA